MSNPIFSVIIPTFNREKTINRAVQSVLCQKFIDFELIIIDDGSKDNTERVVKSIIDDRIIFYKHHTNKGQNAALNTGLTLARGKYISFLDSDDEWLNNILEKQLEKFLSDSEISCVYSYAGYKLNGQIEISKKFNLEGYILKEALSQGYISHMITLSVKRECFDKVGSFDTNFIVCQDDDICLRLAKEYKFGLIKEVLAIINDDSGNQTISNKKNYAEGWFNLFIKFEDDIKQFCGNRIACKHFTKSGFLFILANENLKARKSLCKAIRYSFNYYTILFIIFSYIPIKKLKYKLINYIINRFNII
jgi:glycosyltransferase involved in cell wall biosynthesis